MKKNSNYTFYDSELSDEDNVLVTKLGQTMLDHILEQGQMHKSEGEEDVDSPTEPESKA